MSTAGVSERLDRLPFTRRHLKVLTGSGIGWALDAMDVGLISFVIAALAAQWQLTGGETAWIASIGFIGMAVGASLGGLLADRFGRRQIFALTLLIYGIATGASALAGGLAVLLVLRFFVGLGLGAELPVASTFVSEFAPARIRGRVIVILEAFWAVGWTAAALISFFVIPASDDGWRWALAIGMVPAVWAIVVRWGLPESPRWLSRRGRDAQALSVVASFEASPALLRAARDRSEPVPPAVGEDAGMPAASAPAEATPAPPACGCGARLGRALLEQTLLAHDGVVPKSDLTQSVMREYGDDPNRIVAFGATARPADFARYAPLVFESADQGDTVAMSVVAGAVADVNAALGAIVWDGCKHLCLTGGLAENYQHRLAQKFIRILQPVRGNALAGAVELAVETFVTQKS